MEFLFKTLLVIATVVFVGVLIALPLMILWNLLMPEIFGLITISFWQALGLSFLSSILFKGTNNSKDKE